MVMTVMSVATPIVNPSTVREARSLCACSALKHWAKLSLTVSMAAEKDFSHHITRFWGIATYGLADDAPTVSNHFKEVSLEGHTEPDRINPQKLGEDRPLRL